MRSRLLILQKGTLVLEKIIKEPEGNSHLIAIDIGSNSVHMLITKLDHGELRSVDALSEKIQLASGLHNGKLSDTSIKNGLACLSRFNELLSGISKKNVRAVGTNALRKAKNRRDFLEPAQDILGVPIEVIYGREEARLVYLGVAHSLADDSKSRLVIDIGGGSTEFIIGQKFEPVALESLQIGCLSFAEKYFPKGKITGKAFQNAYEAAALEVSHISGNFLATGWRECVGSSGTLQSIETVAVTNGWTETGINLETLQRFKEHILLFNNFDEVTIDGLNESRRNVIVTGVAITLAIFSSMNITSMRISKGALREGVVYDLLGRLSHEDVRERTINALMLRYGVDQPGARSVAERVQSFFASVRETWNLSSHDQDILYWASLTHEIGMLISHKHYNRHSAYLLRNADLPGFSQGEQEELSLLTNAQRGKIKKSLLADFSKKERTRLSRMVALIRISILLKYTEESSETLNLELNAKKTSLTIHAPETWLSKHPLTHQAIKEEKVALAEIGITLKTNEQKKL